MDDELIQFKGVTKKFGSNLVLDSVNLAVPEKKITGIIGASGEGKTTILKLIVGFYEPTNGDVIYSKRKISKDMENIRNIFGFSTEDGSFYENLSVIENIRHFGYLHHVDKKDIDERSAKLLKLVELEHAKDTLAKNLSMGMKKRLDVAISLIHNPEFLIMDEPTADLDPLLRKGMLDLIKKINQGGTTIILTTQILGEMEKVCDRIAILFDRKIVEEGDVSKIKEKYKAKHLNEVFGKIFIKEEENKIIIKNKFREFLRKFTPSGISELTKGFLKKIRKKREVDKEIEELKSNMEKRKNLSENSSGEVKESEKNNKE